MIPFMKLKWVSLTLSSFLLVGLFYYTQNVLDGFNQGIEFAGGLKLEVATNKAVTVKSIKSLLKKNKIKATIQKAGTEAQEVVKIELGSNIENKIQKKAVKLKAKMAKLNLSANSVDYIYYLMLKKFDKKSLSVETDIKNQRSKVVKVVQSNKVGPSFGVSLRKKAIEKLLIALILITVYVAFRFKFDFALGAMIALLHDLFITLGLIGALQIPLSIPVVAALLTILGYSINDTIVVYDRIRENMAGQENIGFDRIIDRSITESLTRTIITSVTTLIAILSVYLLGGEGLKDMSFVLILGIIVGTYSSTFIASPIVAIGHKILKRA